MAWQHANLFGTFEFDEIATKVDIDALAARYADPAYWSKVKEAQKGRWADLHFWGLGKNGHTATK